jgi:hypothetical protein
MRADTLADLLPDAKWQRIDTDSAFRGASRPLRSLAFRLKAGPLVKATNRIVVEAVSDAEFELTWVDKGVYLWPEVVSELRIRSRVLVHFTPDTAFHANRSRHFFRAAKLYDLLVTTKSFELEQYRELADPGRILLTTQGYDAQLHRPPKRDTSRRATACFIGHCEPDREKCMKALLQAGVTVRLGGAGWEKFVAQWSGDPGLTYLGPGVFGEAYVAEYGANAVGLGLLSKRFPELHTTRTFEIPACGALLATERTADTTRFFDEGEALFFDDYDDLAQRLPALLDRPVKIQAIAAKGRHRLLADGRDYAAVLSGVLDRVGIAR